MKDVLGREMQVGQYAVMYSDSAGKQLIVLIEDYNPITGKIKVTRQDEVGRYEKKTFWTNYWKSKFFLLVEGPTSWV